MRQRRRHDPEPSWASAAPRCSIAIRPISRRGRAPRPAPRCSSLLRRLQLTRPVGSYVCVHAGVSPAQPLAENSRRELLWLREPFLTGKDWRHRFTAIHGHTIRGPEVLPPPDRRRQRHLPHRRAERAADRERPAALRLRHQRAQAQGVQAAARAGSEAPVQRARSRWRRCPSSRIGRSARKLRSEHGQRSLAPSAAETRGRWRPDPPAQASGRAPAAFASTCSTRAAFGIASTPGCARTQASAIWNGAAAMRPGESAQHAAGRQPALLDRAVGHDRHAALAAPGQQVPLDAAARGVVEHLVGGTGARRPARPPARPSRRRRGCSTPQWRILPSRCRRSNAATVSARGWRRASAAGRGRAGRCRAASGCARRRRRVPLAEALCG